MIGEINLENSISEELKENGWTEIQDINRGENKSLTNVIDFERLKKQIIKINNVSDKLVDKAILEIRKKTAASWQELAYLGWKLLVEGIKVVDEESNCLTKTLTLISKSEQLNQYNFVRQLTIESLNNKEKRRPDITLYVNGLPVVVMELKSSCAYENAADAFKQNESLKYFSPDLWKFNILNIVATDTNIYYGSVTSSFQKMAKLHAYKTRESEKAIPFLLSPKNLYQFIELYAFYSHEKNGLVKYVAAPHQIEAVKRSMKNLDAGSSIDSSKGGVVWHTQGSGKSVTMLILTRAILNAYKKATILLVSDRTELDNQLYSRFAKASDYLNNQPIQIQSRQDLINHLDEKKNFGIYFTTIQKFGNESKKGLSQRDDIFVLVDEGHRTQNNLESDWKLNKETELFIEKYGYAVYMRKAFPNAHFVAFTGTPLMGMHKKTTEIFGDYNHKYLMTDSIEDGTTVKINYELRKINYEFNHDYLKEMDELQKAYIKELNQNDLASQQKVDELSRSIKIKQVLENPAVIKAKALDIIEHYKKRSQVLHGKAMVVAGTRKSAFEYYKQLKLLTIKDKELHQITGSNWEGEEIILVMTSNNKDTQDMVEATIKGDKEREAAEEFKKENSKHKIVIVVDKWLTGFDVPDLDTMYLDKIIRWHNLMQAIARVNRTYEKAAFNEIKENGLIVDYIGIWVKLKDALIQYTKREDDPNDFSIDDIEEVHQALIVQLLLIEEKYIPNLLKTYKPNWSYKAQEAYRFIMNGWEIISNLEIEERNDFLKRANIIKKLAKSAHSVTSPEENWATKVVSEIYALQNSAERNDDVKLFAIIEQMKSLTEQAISVDDKQTIIEETRINRDLGEIAILMQKEANELASKNPKIAVEIIKTVIRTTIDEISVMRPITAENASARLQKIILEFNKTIDAAKLLDQLNILFKEMQQNKEEWLKQPPELQAFMEIIANDEYFQEAKNSAIVEEISEKLVLLIKNEGIDNYDINPRIRTFILKKIKKLLRDDYNYPPERLGGVSKILIDSIDKQIKINPKYFIQE